MRRRSCQQLPSVPCACRLPTGRARPPSSKRKLSHSPRAILSELTPSSPSRFLSLLAVFRPRFPHAQATVSPVYLRRAQTSHFPPFLYPANVRNSSISRRSQRPGFGLGPHLAQAGVFSTFRTLMRSMAATSRTPHTREHGPYQARRARQRPDAGALVFPACDLPPPAGHAHFPLEARALASVNGAQQAKGRLSHRREALRGAVFPGTASVPAKTHAQRPTKVVLYRPAPADYPAEFLRRTAAAADVIPAGHLCLTACHGTFAAAISPPSGIVAPVRFCRSHH